MGDPKADKVTEEDTKKYWEKVKALTAKCPRCGATAGATSLDTFHCQTCQHDF